MPIFNPRYDLGIRALLPKWRRMVSREHLRGDVLAALTVACIAIPLSLAIALASGVKPETGLITAIVGGLVGALFGGAPLAVSGPAAAMAVLVASVVEQHGLGGLLAVTATCGLLQVATGALGLGQFMRLVPLPVVEGFTAGIGAIILVGQLPRVLGLPPPSNAQVLEVLKHIGEVLAHARLVPFVIASGALGLTLGLKRLGPLFPGPLVAVALPTVVVAALGLDVELIGAIPRSLPFPTAPAMPALSELPSILALTFIVYALASLESLLSATAVDKLSRQGKHDPDQELVGQGLANVASALFGGIPVTSVIVRSTLNVQAGGRTRRAALLHAVVVLLVVYLIAPVLGRVPVAALAGLLAAVALRMLAVRRFIALWRESRSEGVVYLSTFAVMLFVDLVQGVQWGVVAALAITAIRLGRMPHGPLVTGDDPCRVQLAGPLTFLSSLGLHSLRKQVEELEPGQRLVIELEEVNTIDTSAAEQLADLAGTARARGVRMALRGLHPELARRVVAVDHAGLVQDVLAQTDRDVLTVLASEKPMSARQRLQFGVDHYRRDYLPRYAALFRQLAPGQSPHTLFITCADSRIQPNLMTSSDPGELFLIRNVGNIVPLATADYAGSTGAAVEYAVGVLGVSQIVVCGHSGCGAIAALSNPAGIAETLPALRRWVGSTKAAELCQALPSGAAQDEIARLNARSQLDNLRGYGVVQHRSDEGQLKLHAWFFDIFSGQIEEWNVEQGRWIAVASRASGAS
ncbi:MAG: bifunctional SulP family inorganic anion transporter/carbonic anhydrase [Proteobacteria bacterium]|nr:bifunctional SulP family inorganic anion transporter/carbonic anhydrase [Pseudomonadota bacterium]